MIVHDIKTTFCIPHGMHRSVEWNNAPQRSASHRDASFTGCKEMESRHFSTERCIPDGIPI